MPKDTLAERGKGLEDEFFRKREKEVLQRLREKHAREESLGALAEICGFSDENVLGRLVDLGIEAETLASLSLAPLLAVAWADGKIEDREREAILSVAVDKGIHEGTAARELLESWLQGGFSRGMVDAWHDYIRAVCEELGPDERAALQAELLDRARDVAAAAGGFLGLGSKISRAEQQVLDRLAAAFEQAPA
jgi:hypothetical protein